MDKHELEKRTLQFALKIIAFIETLPKGKAGDVVGYQLVKAGTSVGANYREANRSESRNDFIQRLQSSRRRQPRVSIGSSYVNRGGSEIPGNGRGCCKKAVNF